MKQLLTEDDMERRGAAVIAVKHAGEILSLKSEDLREAVDALQKSLVEFSASGNRMDQEGMDKVIAWIGNIRRQRNAMEAFGLLCKLREEMQEAWRALP